MSIHIRVFARRALRFGRLQFWLAAKYLFPFLPLLAIALIVVGLVTNWLVLSINSVVAWFLGILFSASLANLSSIIYDEAAKELKRLELEGRTSLVWDSLSPKADTSVPPRITEKPPAP
jgi:hypothetical protein